MVYDEVLNKNYEYLLLYKYNLGCYYYGYLYTDMIEALKTFLWYIRNCTILENHHGIYQHCSINDNLIGTILPFYEKGYTSINDKIYDLLCRKGRAKYLLNIEECKNCDIFKNDFLRIKYFNYDGKIDYVLIYKAPFIETNKNLKFLVDSSKSQFCEDYNIINLDFSFNLYDTIDQYILRFRKI